MSKRELRRVGVLARVASEELTLVDAGKILSLSYRQVKRIWQRYEKEGAKGLKAPRCRERIESREAEEVSCPGDPVIAEEVQWRDRGKIWPDVG